MKNMEILLAFVLAALFAAPAGAVTAERLQPILQGPVNISIDSFIIGTQDRYIASIVRDIDQGLAQDLTMGMVELLTKHGPANLVLVEKQVFDKNAKKFSLAERSLNLKSDMQSRLAAEPSINADLLDVEPGSLEEFIWNKVAGPDGLGRAILGVYPGPVPLDLKTKSPTDVNRYVPVAKKEIGGIFLDRDSIRKTDQGCSALLVEAFDFDLEYHLGGVVMQSTYQPYADACYAISEYDFSFTRVAFRQSRYTVFGPDHKVIYAVKDHVGEWTGENSSPVLPYAIMVLRRNLPPDVAALLDADVKFFDAYVQKKIVEAHPDLNSQEKNLTRVAPK